MEYGRPRVSHVENPVAVFRWDDLRSARDVYVAAHKGRSSVNEKRQIGNVVLQLLDIGKKRRDRSEFIMRDPETLERRNLEGAGQRICLRPHNVNRVPAD